MNRHYEQPNKTRQDKTKQNKTKQNKTKGDGNGSLMNSNSWHKE